MPGEEERSDVTEVIKYKSAANPDVNPEAMGKVVQMVKRLGDDFERGRLPNTPPLPAKLPPAQDPYSGETFFEDEPKSVVDNEVLKPRKFTVKNLFGRLKVFVNRFRKSPIEDQLAQLPIDRESIITSTDNHKPDLPQTHKSAA